MNTQSDSIASDAAHPGDSNHLANRIRVGHWALAAILLVLVLTIVFWFYQQSGLRQVSFEITNYQVTENDNGTSNLEIAIEYLAPNEAEQEPFSIQIQDIPREMIRTDISQGEKMSFKYQSQSGLFFDLEVPEIKLWKVILNKPSSEVVAKADLKATANIQASAWK